MEQITVARTHDADPAELALATPTVEDFVFHAVKDASDISDDPEGVVGWFGGTLYGDKVLVFDFTKHGERFAGPGDESPDADRADAVALFLAAEAVKELLVAAGVEEDDALVRIMALVDRTE